MSYVTTAAGFVARAITALESTSRTRRATAVALLRQALGDLELAAKQPSAPAGATVLTPPEMRETFRVIEVDRRTPTNEHLTIAAITAMSEDEVAEVAEATFLAALSHVRTAGPR